MMSSSQVFEGDEISTELYRGGGGQRAEENASRGGRVQSSECPANH